MGLVMVPYAQLPERPFPDCADVSAAAERDGLIAFGWQQPQVPGVVSVPSYVVAVYDAGTRRSIARFTKLEYRVNDLAFHPTRDELAIATGENDTDIYDNGALVIWSWRTGASHSELAENRHVTALRWIDDDTLEVWAVPHSQLDDDVQSRFALRVGTGGVLEDGVEYDEEPDRPLVAQYRELLRVPLYVMALGWHDRALAIGGHQRLELWNPTTNELKRVEIDGDVMGMWRVRDTLLVQIDDAKRSMIYAVRYGRLEERVELGRHMLCSIDAHDRILARDMSGQWGANSKLIDAEANVSSFAFGAFDRHSHRLKIDGGPELYYLFGETRKTFHAVALDGKPGMRWMWDSVTRTLSGNLATIAGDTGLVRAYRVRENQKCVIDLVDVRTGRSIWSRELPSAATALAVWQGCAVSRTRRRHADRARRDHRRGAASRTIRLRELVRGDHRVRRPRRSSRLWIDRRPCHDRGRTLMSLIMVPYASLPGSASAEIRALEWIDDGRVAIGRARKRNVLVWEPLTGRTHELPTYGEVVSLWRRDHDLLVQSFDGGGTSTSLITLDGDEVDRIKMFAGEWWCSTDRHGRILARQRATEMYDADEDDPDECMVLAGARSRGLDLGQTSPLRIDNGSELLYVRRDRPDKRTLYAYTLDGDVQYRMPWDRDSDNIVAEVATVVPGQSPRTRVGLERTGSDRAVRPDDRYAGMAPRRARSSGSDRGLAGLRDRVDGGRLRVAGARSRDRRRAPSRAISLRFIAGVRDHACRTRSRARTRIRRRQDRDRGGAVMPFVMVPYAARATGEFPEVTNLTAAAEREDVIALAWRDRFLNDPMRAVFDGHDPNAVAIYDARTHARIAIHRPAHQINDVAIHPTRDELLIATGAYDGGFMFDGALLIWNWRTGELRSLIAGRPREVTHASWTGDHVTARISPPDDDDDAQPDYLTFLLTTGADQTIDPTFGEDAPEPPTNPLLKKYATDAHPRITALEWSDDGRLAIGRDHPSSLQYWDPATNTTTERSTDGTVFGLWRRPEGLLVEAHRKHEATTLYTFAEHRTTVRTFGSIHVCSVDRRGRILARGVPDYRIRSPRSELLWGGGCDHFDLGNYDPRNHCIRLDGGTEIYYLQSNQNLGERLFAITASGQTEPRMRWNDDPHHLTYTIATLVDDRHVARGYVPGVIELAELTTGDVRWKHEIACGIAAMVVWQDCVVAGLLDGTFLALAIDSGEVVHQEPYVAMITALATHDEALAIGTIDGRIAIVTSR
ncbi:MAG: hypothetical protein QM831_20945 [Kofleriaceae bacterium]